MDSGKTKNMAQPVETAVKLATDNVTTHSRLAIAYQQVGRKEDAAGAEEHFAENQRKTLRRKRFGTGGG
jgi:hypothetical protein